MAKKQNNKSSDDLVSFVKRMYDEAVLWNEGDDKSWAADDPHSYLVCIMEEVTTVYENYQKNNKKQDCETKK